MIWLLIVLFAVCFFLGSIPFGLIISKVLFKKDIRDEGSGNIGATNAVRTMGKAGGAAVFALDFGKGLLSGLLGFLVLEYLRTGTTLSDLGVGSSVFPLGVAFMGCVWGHIYTPWLHFKGGKGISVAVGCLFFAFGVPGALFELAIFIVLVLITRYVSVGSIASAIACPFVTLFLYFGDWPMFVFMTLGALAVIWAHRANMSRLIRGEENRIGKKI